MEPGRDLDDYGRMLFSGDVDGVKADFFLRVFKHARTLERTGTTDTEAAKKAAAQELYKLYWGPTRVPIFDLMLLAILIVPRCRERHLEITRWLLNEAKVPVDGKDLSGSNAICHAISTKPAVDLEFAQILYDAGADINLRNRYGCVSAHEITMVWEAHIPEKANSAATALRWFLSHGGNMDIKDNDGMSPRNNIEATKRRDGPIKDGMRVVYAVVDQDDARREQLKGKCCTFCGIEPTENVELPRCSRCRVAKYCSPPRQCQKGDWLHHKKTCKPQEKKK